MGFIRDFEANFEANFFRGEKVARAAPNKLSKKQREATATEPKAAPEEPAGGKTNGRQREATATEPKAAPEEPAGGKSHGRQWQAS